MFAECYVFIKQSQPPFYCNPFTLHAPACQATRAYLIPKLRYQFAEFLLPSSLKRLRILISPTCVGLRYGPAGLKLRGFSWNCFRSLRNPWVPRPRPLDPDTGFAWCPPPDGQPGLPTPGRPSAIRPPIASSGGAGILTRFPSATHLCLALGAD